MPAIHRQGRCPRQSQEFSTRRALLQRCLVGGAGFAGVGLTACEAGPGGLQFPPLHLAAPIAARAGRVRFAHLTDMHVGDNDASADGYAAALGCVAALDPRPDFLIIGGDHIRCSLYCGPRDAARQWDAYDRAAQRLPRLPRRPTLGNHDILGWGDPKLPPGTVGYGAAMALERLGLDRPYYAYDAGTWHFIHLDNVARREAPRAGQPCYFGGLGPRQAEWLKADLAAASSKRQPICVISHIPLLAACVFFDGHDRVREDFYHVPDAWMHRDVKPLLLLLRKYGVRLLVSGHIHLVDRVDYLGMTFICDGAVSGAWWAGPSQEFPPGYGLFDLYDDGSFSHEYRALDWKTGRHC